MGNITARIEGIISVRKKNLEKIEAAAQRIGKCYDAMRRFEGFKANLTDEEQRINYLQLFQGKQEVLDRIAGISTSDFRTAYNEYAKKKDHLKARFSREELHISFIGRAGQGKSCIM